MEVAELGIYRLVPRTAESLSYLNPMRRMYNLDLAESPVHEITRLATETGASMTPEG